MGGSEEAAAEAAKAAGEIPFCNSFRFEAEHIDAITMCYSCYGTEFMTGPLHYVKNTIGADGNSYGKVASQWINLRKTQYGRSESNEKELIGKLFKRAAKKEPRK